MPDYAKIAKEIRLIVLDMIFKAQSSHIGSNFSCVDILTVLYANADFKKDKLVVSKGWVAATIYALGVKYGLMPQEAIDTYCQEGSKFIGLIEPLGYWGCEAAGGSMGYGLPFAVGFALAKKIKGEEGKVYCLMSDGEQAIGTTWESLLIAQQHNLDNLIIIVDDNGFQAMGKTQDILDTSIPFKYTTIDGHNFEELHKTLATDWFRGSTVPYIVNAITTKGKGVSFMEGQNKWHYKNIDKESYEKAKAELQN